MSERLYYVEGRDPATGISCRTRVAGGATAEAVRDSLTAQGFDRVRIETYRIPKEQRQPGNVFNRSLPSH